ncbi:hypothetical protein SD70_09615 [Gordoniibacillus kamchatkensis]|uniref:Uncharacterized protein n=1 Tax=Gordoniibacillus kamchatkensis TaxID=1590651 RepID=A0ABR5AJX2_9BACL|nr:hypothetical protein SD70_09615 [Paenibacillus sp. VKM B-2647]
MGARCGKGAVSHRAFYRYRIGGNDVEVMAGLRIEHEAGLFDFPFDRSAIAAERGGGRLPLSLLEDWWLLYSLMPATSKQAKAAALQRHLLDKGLARADRLAALSRLPLPVEIARQIRLLLGDS